MRGEENCAAAVEAAKKAPQRNIRTYIVHTRGTENEFAQLPTTQMDSEKDKKDGFFLALPLFVPLAHAEIFSATSYFARDVEGQKKPPPVCGIRN